jgi:hypothetical protein
MIYYDITKMGAARHRSGLTRVSGRLQEEFGGTVTHVAWDGARRAFVMGKEKTAVAFKSVDWLLTVELFSTGERPGFADFVRNPPCRLAAMFHDAIPIRWPHITWPQSVQRHPDYMGLLAGFDRVFAISEASRRDLEGFWLLALAGGDAEGAGGDDHAGCRLRWRPSRAARSGDSQGHADAALRGDRRATEEPGLPAGCGGRTLVRGR